MRRPTRPVIDASRAEPLILGIFDSGLGGLTVVRRVRALLPREDVVFLADRAHVPYGDRSVHDLQRLLAQNAAYLAGCGVDAIVMGCNTTCAIAAETGWPDVGVPILDLIAAAADAVAASGAKRVGVVATTATARSGAYGAAIRVRSPGAEVTEVAAPELVPLVEAGVVAGTVARDAVDRALAAFATPLDALVLACTHFPFLSEHFARALGDGVTLIDPAVAQAARAAAFVRARGGDGGTGTTRYATTGALEPFRDDVVRLTGALGPHDAIEHVETARGILSR